MYRFLSEHLSSLKFLTTKFFSGGSVTSSVLAPSTYLGCSEAEQELNRSSSICASFSIFIFLELS